jgi:hypothetical protein
MGSFARKPGAFLALVAPLPPVLPLKKIPVWASSFIIHLSPPFTGFYPPAGKAGRIAIKLIILRYYLKVK